MSDGIKDGLQIGVTYRVGLASSLTVIRRRSRPTTTTSMEAATPPLSPTRQQQGKKRRNFLTWGVGVFFNGLWGFVGFLESVGFGLRELWDLNLVWDFVGLERGRFEGGGGLGKMARTWDGGGGLGMVVGGGRLNF